MNVQFPGWRPVLTALLFLFCLPGTLGAASIITRDGQTFTGKILEETDEYILLEEEGVQVRISRFQVEHVQYADEEPEEIFNYRSEYPILGVTAFYPAWGNLVAGYYFKDFGVKVSGGYWGEDTWGAQLNLGMKLSETKTFLSNLSIVVGAIAPKDYIDRTYAGIGVDLNASGFALEGDLVNGKSKETGEFAPVFLFQMGYIHKFN